MNAACKGYTRRRFPCGVYFWRSVAHASERRDVMSDESRDLACRMFLHVCVQLCVCTAVRECVCGVCVFSKIWLVLIFMQRVRMFSRTRRMEARRKASHSTAAAVFVSRRRASSFLFYLLIWDALFRAPSSFGFLLGEL